MKNNAPSFVSRSAVNIRRALMTMLIMTTTCTTLWGSTTYTITGNNDRMTFTVNGVWVNSAEAGQRVDITLPAPASNFQWLVTSFDADIQQDDATHFHFTMPAKNVSVIARQFAKAVYYVNDQSTHGHVNVNGNSPGTEGHYADEIITLTPVADIYYIFSGSLTAYWDAPLGVNRDIDLIDNGNGTWSFTMPEGDVYVSATFDPNYQISYTIDSDTGELTLLEGVLNRENSDKLPHNVKSITATNKVRFIGDCANLFDTYENCISMDLSEINTDSVTDMSWMFIDCPKLTSLDLTNWNTSNVSNMHNMFHGCRNLTTIYVGDGWKARPGFRMFMNCTSLVGGMGTTYDENHTAGDYAHIDGGASNPGYLTNGNVLPGDVNGDDIVNVNDITAVVAKTLGGNPRPFNAKAADIDHDGVVSVADITVIIKLALSE